MYNENTNLIIGAGFSGATIARLLAQKSEKVLVIDKKDHVAGNSYDYIDDNGNYIQKFGSHIFHTSSEQVWNFLKPFANFNQYMHKVIAMVDGIGVTIPFNLNSLYEVFPRTLAKSIEKKLLKNFKYNTKVPILEFKNQEDKDLRFLSDYIYEKVFLNYTMKQWSVKPEQIDPEVTSRVPVYISCDDRYFQDKYQGIPMEGFTKVIENILNHENIEVCLNTDYKKIKDKKYKRIFYTGSIDEFFDYKYGVLPYRSVHFDLQTFNLEFYQANAVINYPNNYDFLRIHEYKYYLSGNSEKTVIAKEYSENFEIGINDRYYPILQNENLLLYNKYLNDAKNLNNVYFLGRLGDYKYYDMDKAILRAIKLFEGLTLE